MPPERIDSIKVAVLPISKFHLPADGLAKLKSLCLIAAVAKPEAVELPTCFKS
jgi:hypothetical protein